MSTTNRNGTPGDGEFALALASDSGFQNEAAQLRARSTLTELLGEAPAYRWTYIAPRVARNATAALVDLQQLASASPSSLDPMASAALANAYVWESLAALEEGVSRSSGLLNAATAYDLAGYQANAICIARNLVPRGLEPRESIKSPTGLTALFLQRMLLAVEIAGRALTIEPDVESLSFDEILSAAGAALYAQGLRGAAHAFLAGDPESIDEAVATLARAEHAFAELGEVSDANLARGVRSLLPVMWRRSTWSHLASFHDERPQWRRYMKLLARGVGRRILTSSSVSELWPSQVAALEAGLLTSDASKVVRMPTSAGKTRVAELAIVDALVGAPGSKCVYVAPFRALVSEVEQTFAALLADLGFRVSSILGTYESDEFEQLLAEDADLVVVTPEKLDLLLRLRADFLERVRLIVLDEAHLVHDLSRGAKFELLLTRLKLSLPNPRFLVLSAVVPDETLVDFAHWLRAGDDGIVTSGWRPSLQRVAALEWSGTTGVLRYSGTADDAVLREFVPGVIQQRTFAYENPATGRINRRRFPDHSNKGQVAAELALEFAALGSVLIFTTIPRNAVSVGKALASRLELMERTGEDIPAYFATPETRSVHVATEWLGADHDVTQLLSRGVAVHHGQLPDPVKAAIETDFRERQYRAMVATNTLAQGVNLPLRTVIVHSVWRGDATSRERIPARDYWNIAGRAGRAREETEGTVIHLIVTDQDRRDYRDFLAARESVEPVDSALFQALVAITESRFTEAALGEAIDSEVLAMVVEEAASPTVGDFFGAVIAESLVAVQAERRGVELAPIARAFSTRRQQIISSVADPALLVVYSATGLSSDSCERLRQHAVSNPSHVATLLAEEAPDFAELADLLLDAAVGIDEMTPSIEFAGDNQALLAGWLQGRPVNELKDEVASTATSVEDLSRFIEDFFAYKLPWGFAGYLRIASRVLDVDELGVGVRFFPSMVKFGVPFPEAAWAMAAGVPLRRVAIDLATEFVAARPADTVGGFLEWLAAVEVERLRTVHGLRGSVLDDVARALKRVGRNPLLASGADLTTLLPMTVDIRGIGYENRRIVALRAVPGQDVELDRDYENVVDQNAVRVRLDSQELGYLPRGVAQLVAPELDTGSALSATIAEVDQSEDPPRVSVVLELD